MKRIAIFRRLTTVPRLLFPAALVLVLLAAPESLIAQASFAPQPPPNVVLQPNQGRPGDVVSVRAVNMPRDRSAKIFFQPPGLRISNIQWGDYVTFRVAVAKNARPGAYTLVISPMQRAPVRVPGAFIVLPAPRERAAPPRVLRVSPQQLDPGKTYTLTLYGEAFQQGMKVDFGADLQNLTPPIVLEPRRAQMTVLVSPTATAGVRLAKATNLQGAGNKGPGGIIVKTAAVMRPAKPVKAEVKLKIPEIKPPEGRIVLMAPNVPEKPMLTMLRDKNEPPMVKKDMLFTWYEENPGIADHYIITFKDKDGKVLAQIERPGSKPYYRVTTALLKEMPPPEKLPFFRWDLAAASGMKRGLPPDKRGAAPSKEAPGKPKRSGGLKVSTVGTLKPLTTQAALKNMSASGSLAKTAGLSSMIGMTFTKKAQATWEVKGYWIHPVTHEEQVVETSVPYPLRFPDPPRGMLDCAVAAQGSALRVDCMSCTGQTACFAPCTYALMGKVDISRNPYPVTVTSGGSAGSIEYGNVYISWGDGTVETLRVDTPPLGSSGIPLWVGGKEGILHTYHRPGNYTIKVYSLPTPDVADPSVPALFSSRGLYASAFSSLMVSTAAGPSGAKTPAPPRKSAVRGASKSPAVSGAIPSVTLTAPSGGALSLSAKSPVFQGANLSLLGEDAYLIACRENVLVEEPIDEIANGPLHLLKIEITGFPGYDGSPPQVSDCAEAFTAQAELSYYGKGHLLLVWFVDGEAVDMRVEDVGPGAKDPFQKRQFDSNALPGGLAGSEHHVCVRAWAFQEMGEIGNIMTSGDLRCKPPSSGGASQETKLVMRPSNLGYASLGRTYGSSSTMAPSSTVQGKSVAAGAVKQTGGSAYKVSSSVVQVVHAPLLISVTQPVSEKDVSSPEVTYQIVAHDPSVPCILWFPAKGGVFKISDLMQLSQEGDGTYSGRGMLHLALPEGPGSYRAFYVPVEFSHFKLTGEGDSRQVASGEIDCDVAPAKPLNANVTGLEGSVTHIKGTAGPAEPLLVRFSLHVSPYGGLTPRGAALAWTSVEGPITPDGDFYYDGPMALPPAGLGHSGFTVEGTKLILDWSRKEGGPPPDVEGCAPGAPDESWVGLRIEEGTLTLYDFGQGPIVQKPSTAGWYISSSGLTGAVPPSTLSQSLSMGGMQLRVKNVEVSVCSSSMHALYGVDLKQVPFLEADLAGTLQVDWNGNLCSSFGGTGLEREYGTVKLRVNDADFNNEAPFGWRVALNATLTFKAKGETLTEVDVDGIRIKGSGEIFWKNGASQASVPLGGSAMMGPVKMDLTQLSIKMARVGGKPKVDFGLGGRFHVSSVLAETENTLKYSLAPGGGGTLSSPEPTVSKFHLDAQFPPVAPVARLKADVTYSKDGAGNWKMLGSGRLSILDTGEIEADFLMGYQGGKDYWLCRVAVPLGESGVPLFPPFLSLYYIQGGLGHNIPLTSFSSKGGLDTLAPTFDDSYLFMAGARVGSSDKGFMYYFDGTLTIKTAGPDAGFRIDVKAWLLTNSHGGNGQFQGFIQYAGNSFDAGLSGEYHLLNNAVWVKAPAGACSVHFGPDGWHIYLGQNIEGLKLQAHVLVADCKGFFMLDNTGFRTGGSVEAHMHYGGSLWGFGAHVNIDTYMAIEVAIEVSPIHLRGDFWLGVQVEAGIDTPVGCLCVSPGVNLHVWAEALPVKVCGEAHIRFGRICWCLVGCCKTYGVTVGGICI